MILILSLRIRLLKKNSVGPCKWKLASQACYLWMSTYKDKICVCYKINCTILGLFTYLFIDVNRDYSHFSDEQTEISWDQTASLGNSIKYQSH